MLQNAATSHRIATQRTCITLRKMTNLSSMTLRARGTCDAELIPGTFLSRRSHCVRELPCESYAQSMGRNIHNGEFRRSKPSRAENLNRSSCSMSSTSRPCKHSSERISSASVEFWRPWKRPAVFSFGMRRDRPAWPSVRPPRHRAQTSGPSWPMAHRRRLGQRSGSLEGGFDYHGLTRVERHSRILTEKYLASRCFDRSLFCMGRETPDSQTSPCRP